MTSAVTRDDVQDVLYKLGIQDPKKIAAASRAIDFYSVTLARRYATPVAPPQGLSPGEHDLDAQITRCIKCEKTKATKLFPYDPKSDSGHSNACELCSDTTQVPRDPDLELECKGCGETKNADSQFRRSYSKTGYRAYCKHCENGRTKCEGDCGKVRFPREYLKGSKVCVFCLAEKQLRRYRKKVA